MEKSLRRLHVEAEDTHKRKADNYMEACENGLPSDTAFVSRWDFGYAGNGGAEAFLERVKKYSAVAGLPLFALRS